MMTQVIHVEGWKVIVFYVVKREHVGIITDTLSMAGCEDRLISLAEENIMSSRADNGITFANPNKRTAVMVIGYCKDACQYYNTIAHETAHLSAYITKHNHGTIDSEDYCYLTGYIAQLLYPAARHVICPCCLSNTKRL